MKWVGSNTTRSGEDCGKLESTWPTQEEGWVVLSSSRLVPCRNAGSAFPHLPFWCVCVMSLDFLNIGNRLIGEWLNKLWDIHSIEYYATNKETFDPNILS